MGLKLIAQWGYLWFQFKVGSLSSVLRSVLANFIKYALDAWLVMLGTATYPTMHFTLANKRSSNGGKCVLQRKDVQVWTPEVHKTVPMYSELLNGLYRSGGVWKPWDSSQRSWLWLGRGMSGAPHSGWYPLTQTGTSGWKMKTKYVTLMHPKRGTQL